MHMLQLYGLSVNLVSSFICGHVHVMLNSLPACATVYISVPAVGPLCLYSGTGCSDNLIVSSSPITIGSAGQGMFPRQLYL